MSQRTYSAKAGDITRQWHLIDVSDKVLGRAASQIATLLKGKHKAMYTPSIDTGDHVVVINAEKVKVTGKKEEQKLYHRQPRAGFPGAPPTPAGPGAPVALPPPPMPPKTGSGT